MKRSFKIFLTTFVLALLSGTFVCFLNRQKAPLVSVIMSTYNREQMVSQAILSILNQTVSDFEFIIVNDGSTDNTGRVLKEFARQDARIKLIENEKNLGLVSSLNKALPLARGTYIARMDDDDLSLPTRFERQIEFMEAHPDVTVTGTSSKTYNMTPPSAKALSFVSVEADAPQCHIESYYKVPILHPSALIRRDFLTQHGITYNPIYPSAEDTDFWHKIALAGGKIVRLAPPLVLQRFSSKKEGYYSEQLYSYAAYLNASLNVLKQGYVFAPKWLDKQETCFILNRLNDIETTAFSKADLEKVKNREGCPPFSSFAVRHNTRSLILEEKENNTVCAAENNCFRVIEKNNEKLLIESETTHKRYLYRRLAGILMADNAFFPSFKIFHPDWQDSFSVFGNQVLFRKKRNLARLVSDTETDLTLEWTDGTREIFVKNETDTYVFQKKETQN